MDQFENVYKDYANYIKAKNEYDLLSREEILALRAKNLKFCQQLLQKILLLTNSYFLLDSPAKNSEELLSTSILETKIQNYNRYIHLIINLQQEIKINS